MTSQNIQTELVVIGSGPVKIWNQDNRATTVLEARVAASGLERQVV